MYKVMCKGSRRAWVDYSGKFETMEQAKECKERAENAALVISTGKKLNIKFLLFNPLSRHCAGIVCTERGRKHGTICTDTKKPGKDQTRNNRARMAIKAGDPGKRP